MIIVDPTYVADLALRDGVHTDRTIDDAVVTSSRGSVRKSGIRAVSDAETIVVVCLETTRS